MKALSDNPSISVVIPVHKGGDDLKRCLWSLDSSTPSPDETIVVADGDTDGSAHLAEEFQTRVLRIPVSGGPARARNLGANSANGEILFFVDADVTVPRDAVQRISTVFQQDPYLAALFGSYDDEPSQINFLSQYKNLLHHYTHQKGKVDASTFWGACGAVRRDVFLALGGFDDSYRKPSIEDIELGYRLKRSGYRIRLEKSLQVKHLKYWGPVSLVKSDFFDRALPWARLILRDRNFIADLNLRCTDRMSVVLIYGLLGVLVGVFWWPEVLSIGGILILFLLLLNLPLYLFFRRKRGFRFALKAIPWHWFYYLYSGLAFGIAVFLHFLKKPGSSISATEASSDHSKGRLGSR